jgi:DNA primase
VTEAIIDAATLLQLPEISRQYTVLALYGTNGFTAQHRDAIEGLKHLKEVILFFDGDDAGKEAVKAIAEKLKQIDEKVSITVVDTPEGEDVNSLLKGHDADIFTHLPESRKTFHFTPYGREITSLSSIEHPENTNRTEVWRSPQRTKSEPKTSIEP